MHSFINVLSKSFLYIKYRFSADEYTSDVFTFLSFKKRLYLIITLSYVNFLIVNSSTILSQIT